MRCLYDQTDDNNSNDNNSNDTTNSDFTKEQLEVLEIVNKERKSNGLKPLTLNKELSNVATIKSQDMINKGYFDHTSPTYGSPFDMMKSFGISYKAAGENIAKGQKTPSEVMNSWMNSSGHRANILSANFTELGVGIAKDSKGTIYWTQMFIGK
uniref:CAP domain-containing protein n=1 Tax=Intestinibacter sp. TaxID=1965304 RepID=UPI002F3F30D3